MTITLEELPVASSPSAEPAAYPLSSSAGRVAMPGEFLAFRLGAQQYGIDILRVQEIRSYEAPTRIANARHFIRGVVNLRGVIVPIIDLRLYLSRETASFDQSTVVIVLNVRGRVIGAVVDSVSDVVALSGDQIKPAPAMVDSSGSTRYILGIGCSQQKDQQRMLILTDIAAMLSSSDIGLFDQ